MAILDDDLLLSVLAGEGPAELRDDVYTTSCWYYRLTQAIFDERVTGALTRSLQGLTPERQAIVLAALDDLPSWVGLVTWRRLVPVMRRVGPSRRLNMLSAEALALGLVLGQPIRVRIDNPNLARAATDLGIDYAVVDP